MGEGEDIEILRILVVGIAGMFTMALAIIFFFVIYQRRLFKIQQYQQTLELSFQKDLLAASLKSQENERQRIGRDLHDEIGALLSASKLYVGQIIEKSTGKHERHVAEKVEKLHEQMIQTVRTIARDLRPVILENIGFTAAIQNMTRHIENGSSIHIAFQHPNEINISRDIELQLYRILQELITNTIRHSQANHVQICLKQTKTQILFSYEDDGKGMKAPKEHLAGFGLKNIASRVNLINGQMDYLNGEGFQIRLQIPYPNTL